MRSGAPPSESSTKVRPPLHAPARTSPLCEANEVGELSEIAGQPVDASSELLRAAAEGLAGLPEALKAADSLTASIYVEAARRNLHYAADLIAINLHRPSTVLDYDEALDALLAEWLT